MLALWESSKAAVSDVGRPLMRSVSKALFTSLSEEERGLLLGDFLIIKDTDVPTQFIPELV
jgi:hypothetical protein